MTRRVWMVKILLPFLLQVLLTAGLVRGEVFCSQVGQGVYVICNNQSITSMHQITEAAEKLFNVTTYQLNVDYNLLTDLDWEGFERIPQLRSLGAQGNKITRLKKLPALPNLKRLALSNNLIDTLDLDAFQDTPSIRYVHLDGNRITKLTALPATSNAIAVYLSRNNLEYVDVDAFQATPHLGALFLSDNLINNITQVAEAFAKYNIRSKLSLEKNLIETVSMRDLKMIGDTILHLFDNPFRCTCALKDFVWWLHSLPSYSNFMTSLVTDEHRCASPEDVSGSRVFNYRCTECDVQPNFTVNCSQLLLTSLTDVTTNFPQTTKILDISFNYMASVDLSAFPELLEVRAQNGRLQELRNVGSLKKLRVLRLNSNNFKVIPSGQLNALFNLEELYMSGNSIGEEDYIIEGGNMHDMQNLDTFDISNNGFGGLPLLSVLFEALPSNLKSLNMSACKIQSLSKDMWDTFPRNITTLDLSRNNISVVLLEHLAPVASQLVKLDLSGNEFKCDCQLDWFADWTRKNSAKLVNSQLMFCSDGTPLSEYNPDCKEPRSFTILIVWITIGFALLFIIIGGAIYFYKNKKAISL